MDMYIMWPSGKGGNHYVPSPDQTAGDIFISLHPDCFMLTNKDEFLECQALKANMEECRFCPVNGLHYKKKCYWFSGEKLTWKESEEDCREKHAQMLVIRSQEEQTFIWKMMNEGGKLPWIGIRTMSSGGEWSWIDGSPLNDRVLQAPSTTEENSCGMLNEKQVISQDCSSVAEWICETEGLLV